ncbi:hypothetical protein [Flavobacterium humi]|nr:hypothetical protein [Flavobacterium humi]
MEFTVLQLLFCITLVKIQSEGNVLKIKYSKFRISIHGKTTDL